MGGTCSTHGEKKEMHTHGKRPFGNLKRKWENSNNRLKGKMVVGCELV
jgi:hypothetical protein